MPTRFWLGTHAIAAATSAGVADALAAAWAVTTDPLSGGTVTGTLTWTRDSTAGSQFWYSNAFGPENFRIIIGAHDTGTPSPSPTMLVDTYAAATILVGLCRNASGSYAGWNQAAPFSGCQFVGYHRLGVVASAVKFYVMLGDKDLILQYENAATRHGLHVGAVGKGIGTGYQESDGFRYGMAVSGSGSDWHANWRIAASGFNYFGQHSASSTGQHFGMYAVGSSSWVAVETMHLCSSAPTVDSALAAAIISAEVPIALRRNSNGYFCGTWAGLSESPIGRTGQAVLNAAGTTHVAVRFSSAGDSADEASFLALRSF